MDFATLVSSRLKALGYEQKDLARAAQVTDSYISQLLTRRKAPPSRTRTDIYGRMEAFLNLHHGELTRVVEIERAEELRRRIGEAPRPLFKEFRELVLRKAVPGKREEIGAIFQREPFGALERLVACKLLDVVQNIARREMEREDWLQLAARVGGRSKEEMRVIVLEFLDTEVLQVSHENCVAFLGPLLDSWDIDLDTFGIEIRLNPVLVKHAWRRYEFLEVPGPGDAGEEPGFTEFLSDHALSGDITGEEIRLLRQQKFYGKRPTKLFYYRTLQNLRDPLHFHES